MAPSLRETLARAAYSTLLRLVTPLYLARLWWRGRHEPAYRLAWLTHGTATGREAGAALLREGDAQVWLPYDTPGAVRRFMRHHRPVAGVIMETEVWPNLLHGAAEAGVPLVLANARLSERSQAKGERLGALMRPAAARFTRVLAQTEDDARRLRDAGAGHVQVVGNLKFDVTPAPHQLARGRQWRQALARSVVLAASTREGEEPPLLQAWQALRGPRPLLLLVPRHPQRFDEVGALVAAAGLRGLRRSAWTDAPPADAAAVDVWLGDSLGEMPLYYALADVALLGGSFAPLGGQNLIEAAACGCPLLMGPHTFNFAQAAEQARAAGAASAWSISTRACAVRPSWPATRHGNACRGRRWTSPPGTAARLNAWPRPSSRCCRRCHLLPHQLAGARRGEGAGDRRPYGNSSRLMRSTSGSASCPEAWRRRSAFTSTS